MSQSFHCLSEVGDVASLREWLMILAASQMPRNTMVLKLSPRTGLLPMLVTVLWKYCMYTFFRMTIVINICIIFRHIQIEL